MRGLADSSDDRRYSAAERRRQVWGLAMEFPGIRVKELAERLNLSVPRIVQLVNDLENDGSVSRSNEGIKVNAELRP
jgi:DNA-binding MarR family transcriptional regulator